MWAVPLVCASGITPPSAAKPLLTIIYELLGPRRPALLPWLVPDVIVPDVVVPHGAVPDPAL